MMCASRVVSRSADAGSPSTDKRNCVGVGSTRMVKGRVVIAYLHRPGGAGLLAGNQNLLRRCSRTSFAALLACRQKEIAMPYRPDHKQQTRGRIVQAARKLFNLRGFEAVSIDEVMSEAGLRRGGFYKHFASKDKLYQEAVLEFICQEVPEAWQRKHVDPRQSGPVLARMILDAY